MRLKIPMTGTVIDYDPAQAAIDGQGISGDPDDCVRPVNIDLGGVGWRLISIDLENDLMEVEVVPPDEATPTEKQQILANAQHILESKTIDEIYAMVGDKRLVKPASVMEKYLAAKESSIDNLGG